jgi:hypothetical protein
VKVSGGGIEKPSKVETAPAEGTPGKKKKKTLGLEEVFPE